MQYTTSGNTGITTTISSNQPKNDFSQATLSESPLSPPLIPLAQQSTGFSTQSLIPPYPPPWPHNFSNPPPRIPRFPAGIPRPGNAIFAANPRLAQSIQQQQLSGMGFQSLTDTSNNANNISSILSGSIITSQDSTSANIRNPSKSLNDVPLPNEEFKSVFKASGQTLSTEKDLLPPGVGPSSSTASNFTNIETALIPSLISSGSSININSQLGFPQQDLTNMSMARTCRF